MKKVPRKRALQIVSDLEAFFPGYETCPPRLFDPEHEEIRDGSWVISWEMGPPDWVYDFEYRDPEGKIFVEPINHFALAVHPI